MNPSKTIQEDIQAIAKNIQEAAPKLSGKTLMITGGAGFLGNCFISTIDYLNRNVLKKPCRIISVDNLSTGIRYNTDEGPNLRTTRHNIKDALKVDEDVHYIIHAAGIASPKFYREMRIETIDVATLGTKNMLELAKDKKVTGMLYFSSSEVYGDPAVVPTPETYNGNVSCTGPRSNYDESKRLGESYCVAYFETHQVPVKIVRPFNIYGPGMRLDDYRVIPNFAVHILHNKPLPAYGGGNHTRTFCYITDGISGFLKALLAGPECNGESFNIGNDKPEISIYQLATTTADLFKEPIRVESLPGLNDAYAHADPKRRCPDLSKAKRMLGYEPKTDLKTGLRRFMTWVKETNPEMPELRKE